MILGLSSGEVLLQETHEEWADVFLCDRTRILEAIGSGILDIQHVGSTAIPGVPAKPILDIAIAVESFERSASLADPMRELGYEYRGEYGIPRRHYFVKGDPRTHHVHIVERASEHWKTLIEFRDLLRSDARAAEIYADAKFQLAREYAHDRRAYQREKDQVIQRMLQASSEGNAAPL